MYILKCHVNDASQWLTFYYVRSNVDRTSLLALLPDFYIDSRDINNFALRDRIYKSPTSHHSVHSRFPRKHWPINQRSPKHSIPRNWSQLRKTWTEPAGQVSRHWSGWAKPIRRSGAKWRNIWQGILEMRALAKLRENGKSLYIPPPLEYMRSPKL